MFSRVNFLWWLIIRCTFHPRVTAESRESPRTFCWLCVATRQGTLDHSRLSLLRHCGLILAQRVRADLQFKKKQKHTHTETEKRRRGINRRTFPQNPLMLGKSHHNHYQQIAYGRKTELWPPNYGGGGGDAEGVSTQSCAIFLTLMNEIDEIGEYAGESHSAQSYHSSQHITWSDQTSESPFNVRRVGEGSIFVIGAGDWTLMIMIRYRDVRVDLWQGFHRGVLQDLQIVVLASLIGHGRLRMYIHQLTHSDRYGSAYKWG